MKKNMLYLVIIAFSACKIASPSGSVKMQNYYHYFSKRVGDGKQELYAFDSVGYVNFIMKEPVQENLHSMLYGFFLEDSFYIRPTIFDYTAPNCRTMINKEIKETLLLYPAEAVTVKKNFVFTPNLFNVRTNESYNPNKTKKVVFVYSKETQSMIKKLQKDVSGVCKEAGWELVVLSLDPVYLFKH